MYFYFFVISDHFQTGFGLNDIFTKQMANYCLEADKYIIGTILYIITASIFTLPLFCWTLFYPSPLIIDSVTGNDIFWIFLNGLIIFILHCCVRVCVALKSPFFIAVGNGLSIPLAFIVDVFVHDYKPNIYSISGATFIIISFLMLEIVKPTPQNICKALDFCNVALWNNEKKEDTKKNEDDSNQLTKNLLKQQSPLMSVNQKGSVATIEQSPDYRAGDSLNNSADTM